MGRRATEVVLSDEEKAELERWRRQRTGSSGRYVRAGIVLDCAAGLSGAEIARRHQTSQQTVSKWRRRFACERLAGLSDAPRSGQPRRHTDEKVQEVLDATLNRRPKKATHWSVRSLSEELGVPRDFVHRVWRAFGLKLHLSHSFKLSTDPHFVEKVRDVVGLYPRPSGPGAGVVRGRETAKVKQWLLRHPRFHCHFTPTYSSWINLVERFFASLTEHQLRRGSHRSVVALERAIRGYLEIHNEQSTPFRWTKSADEIIEAVNSVLQLINRTEH